jgi:hypothetical protein
MLNVICTTLDRRFAPAFPGQAFSATIFEREINEVTQG